MLSMKSFCWERWNIAGGVRGNTQQHAEGMGLRRICNWLILLPYQLGGGTWHRKDFSLPFANKEKNIYTMYALIF